MSENDNKAVSIGSIGAGYPCPKDGETLTLINAEMPTQGLLEFGQTEQRNIGAWCPKCHTVWTLLDEVSLNDLDVLPDDPSASDGGPSDG